MKKNLLKRKFCARRECKHERIEKINDPEKIKSECPIHRRILICGPCVSVCDQCAEKGYKVSSGIGDGMIRISKKGKNVDEFKSH